MLIQFNLIIIIIIYFTYCNFTILMFLYYLQRLRCLVYLCHFYDMSVANEAKRPVPSGVLLPCTTIYL